MLTNSIIGNKIADARKKLNISQAQLAERLFISAQAVGKWERGESMPDIITLNRLAEILGTDLNYFSETSKTGADAASESGTTDTPETKTSDRSEDEPAKPSKKQSWDMSRGNWVDADFSGLKNLNEKFSSSNMQGCKFIASDLSGILLKNNHVENCEFSQSGFKNSRIHNSQLSKNNFSNCNLGETEFTGSNVSGCDFSDADLTGVEFRYTSFEKNTISNAVLRQIRFINSSISGIEFTGTLEDCYFENCGFSRVTFRDAVIKNTFVKTKSLKKVKFINCKADRISYAFLKNAKADMTGIEMTD